MALGLLYENFQTGVDGGVFVLDVGYGGVDGLEGLCGLLLGKSDYGLGLTGYGVAHVASLDGDELTLEVAQQGQEEAGHKLVGVGAALVDLHT